MISYCICSYRARYFRIQVEDIITKTTCPYEILVWINTRAPDLEPYIRNLQRLSIPIRIVGSTPENIGMVGFRELFRNAKYDMITQVDDDVLCISRGIGEKAKTIFEKNPKVKQLVADVIQDQFTTGARPGMDAYKAYNSVDGLWDGPVDGWFSVYHRSILDELLASPFEKFFYLGSHMWLKLKSINLVGALCTKFKVFHICGPKYAQIFDMFQMEVAKFSGLGREAMAQAYAAATSGAKELDEIRSRYLLNVEELKRF